MFKKSILNEDIAYTHYTVIFLVSFHIIFFLTKQINKPYNVHCSLTTNGVNFRHCLFFENGRI